ncbi:MULTISPECIES: rhodanese-like domain-containing protein [Pandoraea]|uniref:Molybdopterin biosynthesis protein MoeB n=2 Tax=Pandoraea TaxID=93217 RepID=A0A239S903_9BURK|nr:MULTISPECIES: rhodanese-like domain-containing protein [Pandoraea]AJC15790.1 sulfurtransferase [Pandoraea sputorum]MCE4060930.1 rhodanese-like domain-containing protein [Pandoraea sputorum]SNU81398.1 molybdopterin biosynthesis protein MoeB [Pandoraea sputorum]VVD67387.1 Thiosulfate sulfurtransferase GlpE [Pandoraea sputorum]VVE60356.1 Thiosulfate sulfurtransferase GlpE [Pandoraea anapnoica]
MEFLLPSAAHKFLQANANALFVDCRSEIEHLFVGHPVGAIHVAWNDGPDWEVNPHFVQSVRKLAGAGGERPVMLICRSGNRSTAAGEALEAAGFLNVYGVLHGFEGDLDASHHRNAVNGWRFDGLPWQQC